MLFVKSSLFLVILSLVVTILEARPSGAPACAANAQRITAAMGAQTGDLQFQIETSSNEFTPGQPINIKITSRNPAIRTYKGLLLYVMPASNNQTRVGKFNIPANHKSNVANCGAITAETDSVITHTSPMDKPLGVDIVWTAPTTSFGDLIVRAAVVGTGPSNWQILDSKPIALSGGGGGMGPGGAGKPARKCRLWRNKNSGAILPDSAMSHPGDSSKSTDPAQGAAGTPASPTTDSGYNSPTPTDAVTSVAVNGEGATAPTPSDGASSPPPEAAEVIDGQTAAGQVQENTSATSSASSSFNYSTTVISSCMAMIVALVAATL